jgi:hypothetical protein
MSMKYLLAGTLAFLASPLSASGLDCQALANSPGVEPGGYQGRCLGLLAPKAASQVPPSLNGAPDDTLGYAAQLAFLDGFAAQGLFQFPLPDFSLAEQVGELEETPNMFGLDFNTAATRLYGIQVLAGSTATRIGTFDLQTGAYRATTLVLGLNNLREQVTGLTIDPRGGDAYLSTISILTNNPQISEARLYRLDINNGVATPIGRMLPEEINPVFIDIAMNCEGDLYAHNITDDALYQLDVGNAEATLIGGHGLPANFAQGMDFDNADGQLYAWIYTGAGNNNYGTLDLDTGAFTELNGNALVGQFEGAVSGTCPAQPIDAEAITGAWFAPYSNGQGFTARYFPESGELFMPWFTFSAEGGDEADQQRWYALFGQIDPDGEPVDEVELSIVQVLGGNFDAPPSVEGNVVGTATLSFLSCFEGVLEYAFDPEVNDGLEGRISMTRLLPLGTDCLDYDGTLLPREQAYEPTFTGSWYDPANAGQGIELFRVAATDDVSGLFYGAWFTFAPDPAEPGPDGQRWFTVEGQAIDDDGVLTATILSTVGGSFDDDPAFAVRIGTAEFTSESCDELVMSYEFLDNESAGDFEDVSGEITLRRLGSCPDEGE